VGASLHPATTRATTTTSMRTCDLTEHQSNANPDATEVPGLGEVVCAIRKWDGKLSPCERLTGVACLALRADIGGH